MNRRQVLIRGFVFAGLAPSLGACFGGEGGQKQIADDSKVNQIRQGVSTKPQIEQLFGEPSGRNFTSTGDEVWTYYYQNTHVDPKTYIPIVGAFAGGATATTRQLEVTFDRSGIVRAYGINNAGASAGFGRM